MSERFKTLSAVLLILSRDSADGEEVLFQKRQNTGYADGFFDFAASGHVEENESMKVALCREAKEEININIKPEDLEFICLIHKNVDGYTYYNGYFKALKWTGEIKINEPEKNAELRWININNLPDNVIDDRIEAIYNYKNKIKYSEFGWKD